MDWIVEPTPIVQPIDVNKKDPCALVIVDPCPHQWECGCIMQVINY